MPRVYVSVGSNIDRERNIRGALAHLYQRYGRLIPSPVYETPAIGFEGDDFYNLVVGFDTDIDATVLQENLHTIESLCGRRRTEQRFASRSLDLDLLTYGSAVRPDLTPALPRRDIVRYPFVLRSLADIAHDECHPEIGVSYGELWRRFTLTGDCALRVVDVLRFNG